MDMVSLKRAGFEFHIFFYFRPIGFLHSELIRRLQTLSVALFDEVQLELVTLLFGKWHCHASPRVRFIINPFADHFQTNNEQHLHQNK